MEQLLHDVRVALRGMRRTPLVYALAALSLALGIAANTSIFSALDAFLLRPLPYPAADSLVRVWNTNAERGWMFSSVSVPDFQDYRRLSRTTDLAAFAGASLNIAGAGDAERVAGTRVTPELFAIVGLRPARGRSFTAEDAAPGAAPAAVISDGLWQRRFGGQRSALGATLLLNGEPHTVIGIMAPGDYFPDRAADVWTPLRFDGTELRDARPLQLVGRIRPGSSIARAQEELAGIARDLERAYPAANAGMSVRIEDLAHDLFNETFRTAATISTVAVAFVLLIACANVANLLLARAAGREREIALRAVLGAGRGRVVRQLLTESVVLAAAGGALGAILSIWGVKWFTAIMPANTPMIERIALDARALGYTALISLGAGVLFGLAPALHATRANLGTVLREAGGRGATLGARGGRLRAGIVVAEVSLALVLLICAGLLIRGYRNVVSVDLGFRAERIMTGRIYVPEGGPDADTARVRAFQERLRARLSEHAGVEHVALANALPLTGGGGTTYLAEGMSELPEAERPVAQLRSISPGFLPAFGIALRQGRDFSAADRHDGAPVVLVNEAFARRNWPGADAVGQRVEFHSRSREVVGVVADYREWGGDEDAPPMLFVPAAQRVPYGFAIAIAGTLPPEAAATLLRATVRSLAPELPLYQVRSMADVVDATYQADRIMTRLLSIFAGMALLLAIVGVYGVMAYNVAQRTQEVGVRMAIGAQPAEILRLVIRQGGLLAGTGIAIGLALAFAVSRFLAAFLYGVSPFDPATFALVSVALLAAALVACWIPAARATRVDPLTALRVD